jgi:hypothetical protein
MIIQSITPGDIQDPPQSSIRVGLLVDGTLLVLTLLADGLLQALIKELLVHSPHGIHHCRYRHSGSLGKRPRWLGESLQIMVEATSIGFAKLTVWTGMRLAFRKHPSTLSATRNGFSLVMAWM